MYQFIIHKSASRGHANHGWLNAHHSFSFANFYNPEKMHFGALRVLNDDTIAGGMGFGMHPHDNMEIITIILEGALKHKDSMGNSATITYGDIQVMSAGTGITHSEYNASSNEEVKLLQIWMFPNKQQVTPRYDQYAIDFDATVNTLQQIVSPNANDIGAWVHQDAWFYMGNYTKAIAIEYTIKKSGNGVYIFVIDGQLTIDNILLNKRDAIGIWDTSNITIHINDTQTNILIMDIPMNV
jgi:quercetin 2,3-dioxygenase